MSKYKHILFDINSTLIDTEEAVMAIFCILVTWQLPNCLNFNFYCINLLVLFDYSSDIAYFCTD